MSIMRNKWMMTGINLAVATLLFIILAPVYDLNHYINQLFYLSFFYLGIGLMAWVTRGGFFDGITYGFRRFTNRMSKNGDYMDDWQDKPLPSKTISGSWPRFFLFHGFVLMVGLLILLVIYYLL
ncbi:DUF3899 domain-containing protein [Halobacillus kuroshimensis]|uniref:DUF3899 domain-containing protein n=2 Tax=Bacillaceae TaxID=186817 RepID=A0ABS3DQV2_9BACI|nr:DUF3899 domain-containing protein [Halobacillus kuroshimensis]